MLITEEYRAANAHLHETTQFGVTAPRFEKSIRHMAMMYKPTSFVDYGSGKNRWVEKMFPDFPVASYDPCIPELAEAPEQADMLVSCDVLEHIEPDCLTDVLRDMKRATGKCAFVTIATREAKKVLPDGRNAHLIVQPMEWWVSRLMGLWKIRGMFNRNDTELELWMEVRS